MKLLLATTNQGKIKEIKALLSNLDVEVVSPKELGILLDDVEETGETFAENAKIKATAAMRKSNLPAMADDSGLVVDALNGEPGVYSARYAGKDAPDEKNVEKLLQKMQNFEEKERGAHFVCVVFLVFPDGREFFAKGECHGKIALEPKGENGFGYDPVFVAENAKTFAELSPEEKAKISHRGKALGDIVKYIAEL
jgi:XTP/dITP diphosphohydrolase